MIEASAYEIDRGVPQTLEIPLPNGADDYCFHDAVSPVLPTIVLDVICAASLAGKDVPIRPWVVRDMVPDRTINRRSPALVWYGVKSAAVSKGSCL